MDMDQVMKDCRDCYGPWKPCPAHCEEFGLEFFLDGRLCLGPMSKAGRKAMMDLEEQKKRVEAGTEKSPNNLVGVTLDEYWFMLARHIGQMPYIPGHEVYG